MPATNPTGAIIGKLIPTTKITKWPIEITLGQKIDNSGLNDINL